MFWNLLRNAGKFTSSPGWVRIRCFNRDEAPQNGDEARKWLVVEVSDSGIGIPSDAMPQLFNAFVQNGAERSRQFGGLGLGLAIAKAIVDRHGGRIAAASDGTGLGSTVPVALLVNDGAEAAARGTRNCHRWREWSGKSSTTSAQGFYWSRITNETRAA